MRTESNYEAHLKKNTLRISGDRIGWDGEYDKKLNDRKIEKIVIEEGVRGIFFGLCSGFPKLKEVLLPESLEYLHYTAFKNTPWYKNNLEESDGCFYLGRFLVDSDKEIERANVREGTVMICERAFSDRKRLKEVYVPDSVKTVGPLAFCRCESLMEVRFPESVKTLFGSCFLYCDALKYLEAPGAYDSGCVLGSESSNSIHYPDYFFIPQKIEGMGEVKRVMSYCYLTSRDRYPSDIRDYNDEIIKQNKSRLLDLVMEKGNVAALHGIAPFAITKNNIDSLIELARRRGITEVTAFLMNWKHENVSAEEQEKLLFRDPSSVGEMKKIWSTKKMPDGTLGIIAYKGFETDVTVPSVIGKTPVTVICEKAFSADWDVMIGGKNATKEQLEQRKRIIRVIIPKGVKIIESRAFKGCVSLTSVVIPDGVKEIGVDAFSGCTSLTSVTIPRSVRVIYGSFFGCTSLTIHAPAGSYAEKYAKEHNIPFEAE